MDVFAGDVATFSCEVSCAGGPEACWWLDGTLLQDSPQSAICVHDGTVHSLTLSGLGVADSGTITYRAGPLVSTAKLLVKGTSDGTPPALMLLPSLLPQASCRLRGKGLGTGNAPHVPCVDTQAGCSSASWMRKNAWFRT